MKTYQQFADEMTLEKKAEADALVGPAPAEPLMCFSDSAGDVQHFKALPVAELLAQYPEINDIVWESHLPDELMEQFESDID